jgi:UTP--glucose-1-phosphate uridylyltransferase
MNCQRAVIAVGGYGTRMMPWSYAMEKAMLPIVDNTEVQPTVRPLVDFIVQDCVRAGITDITFVHTQGATGLKTYYTGNPNVDRHLHKNGKDKLLSAIRGIGEQATFRFIEQPDNGEYGTSVPLRLAREVVDQPGQTLYLLGDQFFHGAGSETERLIKDTSAAGTTTGMLTLPVAPEQVSHYGIVLRDEQGFLREIREKPAVGSVDSTDANVGICVVDQSILPHLDATPPHESGEHLFTDVMTAYANDQDVSRQPNKVAVVPAHGTYLDCGTPENYMATLAYMAR